MTEPQPLPFGSWPSPISAQDVARGGIDLEFPGIVETPQGPEIWWIEGRPAEQGRMVLVRRSVDGSVHEVLGPQTNVRSRIIEYGARPWNRVSVAGTGGTVFCSWDDQRLHLLVDGAAAAIPLTPISTDAVEHRYGEPVPGIAGSLMVVRETHRDGSVSRALVKVPLDGSGADNEGAITVLNDQHHFYANPRLSPDGRHIAYVAWDHPYMPWDRTVLAVIDTSETFPATERVLAGGSDESLLQPEWADDSHLYVVSDRSGWWNLYRTAVEEAQLHPLCSREEEFAGPLWQLGYTTYAVLGDGRLAVTHGQAETLLSVLDPDSRELVPSGVDVGLEPYVTASRMLVTSVGGSTTLPLAVVAIEIDRPGTAGLDVVRQSYTQLPDAAFLPRAEPRTFVGPSGRDVHTFVYPPTHPECAGTSEERPPYLVFVHGGPTAHVSPGLSLGKAYFTSRGIGVIDVNYGGSTGYGRAYRERLRGQWGVVDVEDCVSAVLGLADAGDADRARLGIRGGSAGGWTTLAALVQSDAFAAGAAYYPVADLLPFAEDTHDFESRYLDSLIGPLPLSRELYAERSPLSHLDQLRTPVILLQGDDDKIVPPSQPQAVNEALAGSGIPHAYLVFAGEQHGFRKAESTIVALEAELSFYGQIFGFTPPDIPTLALEY